jgi:SAM-dependent methyltransferase
VIGGQRFARLTTDLVVRWPPLWRVLRRPLSRMFDRLAPEWGMQRRPGYLEAFDAALDTVIDPPGRVLDLGSGTGAAAVALATRWPDAEIVGVDVSPGMVDEARRRLPPELAPRVRFEVGDAAALRFPAEHFELVTLVNMIPFFDELVRVCATGGRVLVFATQGPRTPIYVPPARVRRELERRGFTDFAEFTQGSGSALLARKADRS